MGCNALKPHHDNVPEEVVIEVVEETGGMTTEIRHTDKESAA